MKQNENLDNSKNDTWPLCEGEQHGSVRHPVAAGMTLNEEVNKVVMEGYFSNQPFDDNRRPIKRYKHYIIKQGLFVWSSKGNEKEWLDIRNRVRKYQIENQ